MLRILSALALVAVVSMPAAAAPITFVGSSGTRSASATFADSGTTLTVTLTNTSVADVLDPIDVLTAVFFTTTDPALTPVSAVLAAGSSIKYDTLDSAGNPLTSNVGGEWGYRQTTQYGTTQSVSSVGLGIFGDGEFTGPNLGGPPSGALNGIEYGILSAGDNFATGNSAIINSGGLIWNAVVFTLSGWSGGDASAAISAVTFQYGGSLTDPSFVGTSDNQVVTPAAVPEPATLLLLGTGFGAAAMKARRRQAKA